MFIQCTPSEAAPYETCRVVVSRDGTLAALRVSRISWKLARRLLPKLCQRHGIAEADQAGLFVGSIIRSK